MPLYSPPIGTSDPGCSPTDWPPPVGRTSPTARCAGDHPTHTNQPALEPNPPHPTCCSPSGIHLLLDAAKHGRPTASIQDPRHLLGADCPPCTSHSNKGELPKSVPFNDLPIPRAQNILQKMRARQS